MISEEEKQTLNTYNKISSEWVSKRRSKRDDIWASELKRFKSLLPSGSVLDIGCGSGTDSFWFLENGYEYLGIDGSSEMIDIAKKNNPKAPFLVKTFDEIPSLAQKFNSFWAAFSLLHVPKSRISEVLESIKKVILPGGIGFISIKQGSGESKEIWEDNQSERFFAYYEMEEFCQILKQSQLTIIDKGKRPSIRDRTVIWLSFFVKV